MVSNEKKWNAMNPIFHQMKKHNPSNGQNSQLVHQWLLIHFGPMQCTPKKHTTPNLIGRLNMPSKCFDYYYFSFAPNMFPSNSQCVPIRFFNMFPMIPMCSPKVFQIAPCFNPVCFAQSTLLFTYIVGPKGEALHLSIESSIFWEPNFCFWQWANQIGSLLKN